MGGSVARGTARIAGKAQSSIKVLVGKTEEACVHVKVVGRDAAETVCCGRHAGGTGRVAVKTDRVCVVLVRGADDAGEEAGGRVGSRAWGAGEAVDGGGGAGQAVRITGEAAGAAEEGAGDAGRAGGGQGQAGGARGGASGAGLGAVEEGARSAGYTEGQRRQVVVHDAGEAGGGRGAVEAGRDARETGSAAEVEAVDAGGTGGG